MKHWRWIGAAAMLTPIWFALVYALVSATRPEFRHFNQAVSELGSWEAPHRWWWNLLGYVLPGLVVVLLGQALKSRLALQGIAAFPCFALSLSGLLMVLSGVFPGDFENRAAPSMQLHSIGAYGSGLCFIVAAFGLSVRLRKLADWRGLNRWAGLALAGLLLSGFWRVSDWPGLGQRLSFACFFVWVALLGFGLYRAPRTAASIGRCDA